MRRYRLLPHTADIMVQVEGGSLEELFENAACALGSVIYDRRSVRCRQKKVFSVEGYDLEDLLFNFLRFVFSLFSVDSFLWRNVGVRIERRGEEYRLSVLINGEPFDDARHTVKEEVKAITYHNLKVERVGSEFKATFIVDV